MSTAVATQYDDCLPADDDYVYPDDDYVYPDDEYGYLSDNTSTDYDDDELESMIHFDVLKVSSAGIKALPLGESDYMFKPRKGEESKQVSKVEEESKEEEQVSKEEESKVVEKKEAAIVEKEEEELEIREEEDEEEDDEDGCEIWGEWEERPYLQLEDGRFEITAEYITESRPIRRLWESGWRGKIPAPIEDKNSNIIRRALDFCKERGKIRKEHWKDGENILKQHLKVFDDNFFQDNQSDAIDFADVACRLQIRSLFYLMIETATEMLTQKTPDDIDKIFKIHSDKDKTTDDDFRTMKRVVRNAAWVFRQTT